MNGHLVLLLAEHSGCDFLFDQRFGAVTSSEFGCCGFVHFATIDGCGSVIAISVALSLSHLVLCCVEFSAAIYGERSVI